MKSPTVSVGWLNKNLSKPNLIILDASLANNISNLKSDYENIRIVGARFFDIKNKFSDKTSDMPNTLLQPQDFERECQALGINQDSKIVVYDNLGIYTAARVWWMFKAMGHHDIAVLNGGLPEWMNKEFSTEPIENQNFTKGNFKSNSNKNLKRDRQDILENINSKEALVLDARSEGRFHGTAPEPRARLSSGHIPNSMSLPYTKVLNDGKLKNEEELKAIFDDLNIADRPLIFSCGSGLTACITMLAAEMVNQNHKSVYDGSWTEWVQKQADLIHKTSQ